MCLERFPQMDIVVVSRVKVAGARLLQTVRYSKTFRTYKPERDSLTTLVTDISQRSA